MPLSIVGDRMAEEPAALLHAPAEQLVAGALEAPRAAVAADDAGHPVGVVAEAVPLAARHEAHLTLGDWRLASLHQTRPAALEDVQELLAAGVAVQFVRAARLEARDVERYAGRAGGLLGKDPSNGHPDPAAVIGERGVGRDRVDRELLHAGAWASGVSSTSEQVVPSLLQAADAAVHGDERGRLVR